jgi:phosphatidylglycerophosphate synthase
MSKLTTENKFIDFSDYARPFGKFLAKSLQNTRFTPIHVTLLFGICGLISAYFILNNHFFLAAVFLLLKSGIDAADGELARLKNKPSYTGRFLDSIFDIILNFVLFFCFCYVSKTNYWIGFLAFFCIQLQGTLYNFYYVILRNNSIGGDVTSRIFETKTPIALGGENQKWVTILFGVYTILYGGFDKIIQFLDNDAHLSTKYPKWFMSTVSIYGLGFQLLIMTVFLCCNDIQIISPFFIFYSLFIPVLIVVRKLFLTEINYK